MNKNLIFTEKAKIVHGDRYDYSQTIVINAKTKTKIICKKHGVFVQSPDKHINRKQGCPKCNGNVKLTLENFIIKAKEKHDNKYDYSLANYKNANSNIKIICPTHGIFEQIVKVHLGGGNCPKCLGFNKTTEDIINEFEIIHGNKYNYSLVNYTNNKTKIKIICKKHGIFEQSPDSHLRGAGCPICSGNKKSNTEEFILKSKEIYGDKYDYSSVDYINTKTPIKIICKEHGIFEQLPRNHLDNHQCPKCGVLMFIEKKTKTTDEFINEANLIHNNKFKYPLVDYKHSKETVIITCSEHGDFNQTPDAHLQGQGCPICGSRFNKMEGEIKEIIKSFNLTIIENDKTILNGQELDIYIPSHKIAIEFNGLYWHSELYKRNNYHLNKTLECEKQGIQLIHIFEDEWLYKQEIVKSRFKNILGLTTNKIYARKCEIKEVTPTESTTFLDMNHLQGATGGSIKLGLYYNNELVSLMLFNKPRIGIGTNMSVVDTYELSRFCNKLNTSVIGGADKLLKNFIKNYHPKEIISYADRRWSQGGLYDKLGFVLIHTNKPNYWYIIRDKRKHRFGFRKHKLKDDGFDVINKSEHEIMIERKIYRIYDCGTITYKKTLTY